MTHLAPKAVRLNSINIRGAWVSIISVGTHIGRKVSTEAIYQPSTTITPNEDNVRSKGVLLGK